MKFIFAPMEVIGRVVGKDEYVARIPIPVSSIAEIDLSDAESKVRALANAGLSVTRVGEGGMPTAFRGRDGEVYELGEKMLGRVAVDGSLEVTRAELALVSDDEMGFFGRKRLAIRQFAEDVARDPEMADAVNGGELSGADKAMLRKQGEAVSAEARRGAGANYGAYRSGGVYGMAARRQKLEQEYREAVRDSILNEIEAAVNAPDVAMSPLAESERMQRESLVRDIRGMVRDRRPMTKESFDALKGAAFEAEKPAAAARAPLSTKGYYFARNAAGKLVLHRPTMEEFRVQETEESKRIRELEGELANLPEGEHVDALTRAYQEGALYSRAAAMRVVEMKPIRMEVEEWENLTAAERKQKAVGIVKVENERVAAGEPIVNADRGREIRLGVNATKHFMRYASDPRKAAVFGKIREVLEQAKYLRSEKPDARKTERNIKAFHRFAVMTDVGGVSPFLLTVQEDANGGFLYDGEILDTKEPVDGTLTSRGMGRSEEHDDTLIQQAHVQSILDALDVNRELQIGDWVQGEVLESRAVKILLNRKYVEAKERVGQDYSPEVLRNVGKAWQDLIGMEGVMQLPRTLNGQTLREMVAEVSGVFPDLKFEDANVHKGAWVTVLSNGAEQGALIYETPDKVWVDVSRASGKTGLNSPETRDKISLGSAVYQMVQSYAKKTGRVFVADPEGVSEIAQVRRWAQQSSAALRAGDSSMIDASEDVSRWTQGGDVAQDIGNLMVHEYEFVKSVIPEIEHLRLSEDGTTFLYADHDTDTPVPKKFIEDLIARGGYGSRFGIGEKTFARAVVTRTATLGGEGLRQPVQRDTEWERGIHRDPETNLVDDRRRADAGIDPGHPLEGVLYSRAVKPYGAAVRESEVEQPGDVLYTFRGQRSALAKSDVESLGRARKLAGVLTPMEVWGQTGWFRGVDGLWRSELDDFLSCLFWEVGTE